jgi:hypothetical protein
MKNALSNALKVLNYNCKRSAPEKIAEKKQGGMTVNCQTT